MTDYSVKSSRRVSAFGADWFIRTHPHTEAGDEALLAIKISAMTVLGRCCGRDRS
jgi:hypothetical protein